MKKIAYALLLIAASVFVLLIFFEAETGIMSDAYVQRFAGEGIAPLEINSTEDVLQEVCDKPGDVYVIHYYHPSDVHLAEDKRTICLLHYHFNGKVKFLSVNLGKIQPPDAPTKYSGICSYRGHRDVSTGLFAGGVTQDHGDNPSYSEVRQAVDGLLSYPYAKDMSKFAKGKGERRVVGWNNYAN